MVQGAMADRRSMIASVSDPDPGGLKRAKMKKKTQQKAR
jgi:hypothetical protein